MAHTQLFAQVRAALKLAVSARLNNFSSQQLSDSFQHLHLRGSRRDFLKQSAALSVAAALPPMRFAANSEEPVLILGAGAAGLGAAYTLLKAGVPFQILEASHRVGGRIFTQFNFNQQGQFIERGGEFIDSEHTQMIALAQEMGLEVEDFTQSDAGVEPYLCYHHGSIYTSHEFVQRLQPMVDAILRDEDAGADEITYHDVAANPNNPALKWDRMPLSEYINSLGLDPWVREILGVAYVGEYGADLDQQSALNLILMVGTDLTDFHLYGTSDESKRIKGGNLQLPMALAKAVETRRPGAIRYGARVEALGRRGSKIVVSYQHEGIAREIAAARVICTLPFTVLREVDGIASVGFSPKKVECIRTMGYGKNAKIMMQFTGRPWRDPAPKSVGYTGAVYGTFKSQSYWESSRLQAGADGILTCFLGGRAGEAASLRMLHDECLPDLDLLRAGLSSTFVKGTVQNWNKVPTVKASYTSFLPGQYGRINGAQGEPELHGRMLFAGEHVSDDFNGFMAGALETGIAAATQFAGVRATGSQ